MATYYDPENDTDAVTAWVLCLVGVCALIALLLSSGCVMRDDGAFVYVAPGQMAEVAEMTRIDVWVTNKKTGNRERRMVYAQAGWYIGRIEK